MLLNAGLTGADGVFPAPGPALAGVCVRGLSGELACGALDSGVRAGGSGVCALAGPSDGLCTPPPACGAIGIPPPAMGAGAVAAGS